MSSNLYKKEIKLKDSGKLIVKEAEEAEAKELIRYIFSVGGESNFLTFGAGEYKITVEEEKKNIKTFSESDNQVLLIGWVQNKIVGCLSFRSGKWQKVRHTGELGISVSKKNWGIGIGSIMMDALLDWARKSKLIRKVNLRVRSDNDRAIAVYSKLGFVKEGTIRREVFIDGEFFDNVMMGKMLD